MSKSKKRLVLGIDVGGTKILSGVVDEDLSVLGRGKAATDSSSQSALADGLKTTVEKALSEAGVSMSDISAIGAGCPGPLDIAKGEIVGSPNLGLEVIPLRAMLEKAFSLPVVIGNDVNVGTYGECRKGAAKGKKNVVGLFPGTGLGGGIVVDGKLVQGASGNAGEIGHMILLPHGPICGCGKRGCAEAMVSRSAIARELAGLAASGKAPVILELAGTDIRNIKSGVIKKALDAKDPGAVSVVRRAVKNMGRVMANCVNIFNPELIILGGGLVEKLGDDYVKDAESSMKKYAMPVLLKDVKVAAASLGDDAVLLGAAALALDEKA